MPKNYYVILGISPQSTPGDIKTAYRRLAKEFHPDYYAKTRSPFQAIQEAYAVLSDPRRRKQYDDAIGAAKAGNISIGAKVPRPAARDPIEPLIPEGGAAEPLSDISGSARHSRWPGPAARFDHFYDTASPQRHFHHHPSEPREILVALTPRQAAEGGHVRIPVPARRSCPDCLGRGYHGMYECWRCFGAGQLSGEIPLLLTYPAGMDDGHIVEIPLDGYGMAPLWITVRFGIDGA